MDAEIWFRMVLSIMSGTPSSLEKISYRKYNFCLAGVERIHKLQIWGEFISKSTTRHV